MEEQKGKPHKQSSYLKYERNRVMKLLDNGIYDTESWFRIAGPLRGSKQWKVGRSAFELASYMTQTLPDAPVKIAQCLRDAGVDTTQPFEWGAEYVTSFAKHGLGRGSGRHHDAALWNAGTFMGIEAKADEPLDYYVSEILSDASDNKKRRIDGLCRMAFGDDAVNHPTIRYQLLTALGGVLLEAQSRKAENAVLLILTFLKEGADTRGLPYYSPAKVDTNTQDIERFLNALHWDEKTGRVSTVLGAKNNINTFVQHYTLSV